MTAKEPVDKVLVGLLGYCGLRIGEAIHLRLNWIREGEIHIPSTMACNCFECYERGFWKPKSKAGSRIVPIPGFLVGTIVDYFTKFPDGFRMPRQSGWYRIQKLVKEAGLPKAFPHSLRATYATLLATKGMQAVAICYLLGWARLEVAQHYVRVAQAREQAKKQIKEIWG